MNGPSNLELFEFLCRELTFSQFERKGSTLSSFKKTIEFTLVLEGTGEGPPEGLLDEGTASLSYGEWSGFVDGFAMSSVESRNDPGVTGATRVYRARADGGIRLAELGLTPSHVELAPGATRPAIAVREELVTERSRYVWTGSGRERGSAGEVAAQARMIACRGADKGMPARLILCEKLALYRRRHAAGAVL